MHLTELPTDLPIPLDDGTASHLTGHALPPIQLFATNGEIIQLDQLKGQYVIYIYPMTGRPNVALPDGWDSIPGARGCTPQSCSFRDHAEELAALNTGIFGLSSQTTEYQQEVKNRLHLPFELLSDATFLMKEALGLPTFNVGDIDRSLCDIFDAFKFPPAKRVESRFAARDVDGCWKSSSRSESNPSESKRFRLI